MNTAWSKPVLVLIGETPSETRIDTTQGAAWAMIEDWPMEDGTALDRALAVCAAVDAGKQKPEDARKAFIDAAVEANILISA